MPLATRVCERVRTAAAELVSGPLAMRVADADPANLECVVAGGGVRLDVVAQASAQAWVQFDTTQVHQIQAYGSGSIHDPAQIPQRVSAPGTLAGWIPAQHELFATNGTQSRAGSYVTVMVSGAAGASRRSTGASRRAAGASHRAAGRRLAATVAVATLAVAPKGPRPVAPP